LRILDHHPDLSTAIHRTDFAGVAVVRVVVGIIGKHIGAIAVSHPVIVGIPAAP
jgi:hypothetical protein